MLACAGRVISEYGIQNVICSGGPFGAMYQTTLLKERFPGIFIMNDMRDPWTWGPNWGFNDLNERRMKFELSQERKMIERSDLITVPTLEMKKCLDEKYPAHKGKIQTLLHFFDKTEIKVEKKEPSKKLRLILYGTIYHHISDLIEEAARTLANFRDEVLLDIYTDKVQYRAAFEKFGATNVRFYPQLPPQDLFARFKFYDYVFLMVPSVGVDHISTKFYEIIYSQTPFLIFCKYGLGPEFVTENRLGVHADLNNLDKTIGMLVKEKDYKDYNRNFDLSGYALEDNARKIVSFLKV